MKTFIVGFAIGYRVKVEAETKRQAEAKAKKEYVKYNYDSLEPKESIIYVKKITKETDESEEK